MSMILPYTQYVKELSLCARVGGKSGSELRIGYGLMSQTWANHLLGLQEASGRKGVLLAFIALDNPSNSLLDMQTVSFVAGKPVFNKYLDTFPFPYYIVLRDIAALPRTLADLLRQWIQISTG
jgi:hypothetical protein